MSKFAIAAVVCSVSLVLSTDAAQARCRCRNSCASSCCTPAPTCCAPAASCAAPAATMPVEKAPAAPPDADAPAPSPSAALQYEDPAVATSQPNAERQTYRSYSYDPATGAGANGSPANKPAAPKSNFFSAGRKMQGIRY
jgi:hypothetical protein